MQFFLPTLSRLFIAPQIRVAGICVCLFASGCNNRAGKRSRETTLAQSACAQECASLLQCLRCSKLLSAFNFPLHCRGAKFAAWKFLIMSFCNCLLRKMSKVEMNDILWKNSFDVHALCSCNEVKCKGWAIRKNYWSPNPFFFFYSRPNDLPGPPWLSCIRPLAILNQCQFRWCCLTF